MKLFRNLLLASGLLWSSAALADNYEIDDGHTSVLFKIKHFGASWVYGRFNTNAGTFVYAANGGLSSVNFTIQTESVDSDLPKRDEHLRGADFFDAAQYPTITFASTRVKKKDADTFTVIGNLTLHGVTKEITVDMDVTGEGDDPWGGHRAGLETAFAIKRSDYGMSHMLEGLSDEVKVMVAIEGVRK